MRLRTIRNTLLVLLLLPILAGAGFLLLFDANALAPRLAAAVQAQTGRQLSIEGKIALKFGFSPTLTLEKVGLANIPGGSREQMLTAEKVELELALLPLLTREIEITRLGLQGPDLLLEKDAQGRPNWRFERPAPPPGTPRTDPGLPGGPKMILSVSGLEIANGKVQWRDLAPHLLTNASLAASGRDPLTWTGSGTLDGLPVKLAAETGPLTAAFSGQDWPVRATIEAARGRFSFDGGLQRGQPRGAVSASIPELAALAPMLAGQKLPAFLAVEAAARLTPTGAEALQVKIGDSTLDGVWPGLRLLNASALQSAPGQPIVLTAEATRGGQPFGLSGSLGAAALTGGQVPLALTFSAADARATFTGSLGAERRINDLNGQLLIEAPNLAALSPMAGGALPEIANLRIEAQAQGLPEGLALRNVLLRSAAGDLTGELLAATTDRLALRGALAGRRLSLDALRIAGRQAVPAPAVPAPQAAPTPRRRTPADLPPVARPVPGGRVIPDTPWPYGFAQLLDGDIRLTIAELISNDVPIRDIEARLLMEGGRATLEPVLASLPIGRVAAKLVVDAAAPPARLAVAVRGEGLDLPVLAAVLGIAPLPAAPALAPIAGATPLVPAATAPSLGRVDIEADLRGAGDTFRALAATASGPFGLAMTEGQLDTGPNSLLGQALGDLRRGLPQLGRGGNAGPVQLRCGALRVQLENGLARTQALLLDGSLGRVGGAGTVNFADESIAMRLLLDLDLPIAGLIDGLNSIRIRAPVPVSGTFARPRADYGQAVARGAFGAFTGIASDAPVGLLDCEVALAMARGTGRPTLAPIAGPGGTAMRIQPVTPPTQFLRDLLARNR